MKSDIVNFALYDFCNKRIMKSEIRHHSCLLLLNGLNIALGLHFGTVVDGQNDYLSPIYSVHLYNRY